MANPEHVKLAKQGAGAIAEWRRNNPEIVIDLTEADLSGADLSVADLTGADLSGANLNGANLNEADLTWADLTRANLTDADLTWANLNGAALTRANLSGADLSGADLTRADLTGADLTGAKLTEAKLSGANLNGADLTRANLNGADLTRAKLSGVTMSGALLGFTVFGGCDLSEVNGLETAQHNGPSTIGVDTLILSKGNIPREFLEGAGVPDTWIEYIPSLIQSEPIEFYSAFLAHSHKDKEFADKLYSDLIKKGVRVWYFPSDARGGRRVKGEIYIGIRYHNKVIVACSKDSLASPAMRDEIDQAVQKQEEAPGQWTLLPISIDDAVYKEDSELARRLTLHVIEDFRRWKEPEEYNKALDKLLRDLATKERPPVP